MNCNKIRGTDTTFVVVKSKINSQPLLGRRTLIELGMLEIRPDGNLKESNELQRTDSKSVKSILDNKAIIVSEYDQEIPQSQTADKPMAPRV